AERRGFGPFPCKSGPRAGETEKLRRDRSPSRLLCGRPASPPIPQPPDGMEHCGTLDAAAEEMADDGASLSPRPFAKEEAVEGVGVGVLVVSHRPRGYVGGILGPSQVEPFAAL